MYQLKKRQSNVKLGLALFVHAKENQELCFTEFKEPNKIAQLKQSYDDFTTFKAFKNTLQKSDEENTLMN